MSNNGQSWQKIEPRLSVFDRLPTSVFMKAKELPARSEVVDHQHNWDQLIYAKSGILEVKSASGNYIIPSLQSVWIPANQPHSIATISGAQLRSVHLDKGLINRFEAQIQVLKVNDLVRELIHKASEFEFSTTMDEQQKRLLQVLVDQISLLPKVPLCLPLSDDPLILPILNRLQNHPDDKKNLQQWSLQLGASSKTISRRFDSKLGMNFSKWREQLKLHKAIQGLNQQYPVTQIALDLGYESLPAFIQMFKRNMGVSPGKFRALNQ